MKKIFLALVFLFNCQFAFASEVTLIKQWHLAPGKVATSIEESKKLPQFENQKDINLKVKTKKYLTHLRQLL